MELSGAASVTHAPAPHLHGSWFTDSSTPLAGGFRASIPLICVALCTHPMNASGDTTTGASATFALFKKERPLASAVKEWIEQSESLLPADQRALVDGRMPRTLLQYRSLSVPPSLVAGGGITAEAVAAREADRLVVIEGNRLRDDQWASHDSEMRLSLFQSIYAALKPNAPLLLNKLESRCKQDVPFQTVNDGVKAWKMINDMGKSDAQLPGEAVNYDAHLLTLELQPLSDSATPDDFAVRVSDAIDNIFPYLKRKYSTPEEIGEWVLSQVPDKHGAECRTVVRTLSADEKRDPHKVASVCVDAMAKARPAIVMLRKGPLADLIRLVDEPRTGSGQYGRRMRSLPSAHDPGEKGECAEKDAVGQSQRPPVPTGKGRNGQFDRKNRERPVCSVSAPRGPMCKRGHSGPCWRDNL